MTRPPTTNTTIVTTRTQSAIPARIPKRARSLQVRVDVNLAGGEIHGSDAPGLSCIDPGVTVYRRREPDVLTKVGDRLGGAWRAHTVGRESDPASIFSLNGGANIKVDAAVGTNR